MDKLVELEYLRELKIKYGAHYLKKYFGFSLKDIADYIGISKAWFSLILQGKAKMQDKYKTKFIEAFKHFDVEEKTKDFKESDMQILIKDAWRKIKLDRLPSYAILIGAMEIALFLKPYHINSLYYIRGIGRNFCNLFDNFKAVVVFLSTAAFLFLARCTRKTQVLLN